MVWHVCVYVWWAFAVVGAGGEPVEHSSQHTTLEGDRMLTGSVRRLYARRGVCWLCCRASQPSPPAAQIARRRQGPW